MTNQFADLTWVAHPTGRHAEVFFDNGWGALLNEAGQGAGLYKMKIWLTGRVPATYNLDWLKGSPFYGDANLMQMVMNKVDAIPMDSTAKMRKAIEDIRPHARVWIGLLSHYLNTLPPDLPPSGHEGSGVSPTDEYNSYTRSYVEHELHAMHRDLVNLLSSTED